MGTATLANNVRKRFKTLVLDPLAPNAPHTVWDNAPDDPALRDALWLRVSVIEGDTNLVSYGTPTKRFRTYGVLIVSIFTIAESGDGEAKAFADVVRPIFRAKYADDIIYRSPSVKSVGRQGKWYQINVVCPFYSDALET